MNSMIKKLITVFANILYRTKKYKILINVFGEEHFDLIGIKYVHKSFIEVCSQKLPDYFIDDDFQRRVYSLFEDEIASKSYNFTFGIFEVKQSSLEMPHGMVRVKHGLVERLMGDTSWPLNMPRYYLSFFRSYFLPIRELSNPVFINLPFDNNYYHWLIETLPRLYILELAGYGPDNVKLIIPPIGSRPSFVLDSLSLVGWNDNQDCLKSGVYTAKNLIVPSLTSPRSRISAPAADWLREKVLGSSSDVANNFKGYERIYIARDDAPTRRVLNSVEVDELMKKHGFVKVTMSGKKVSEQAQILSSAKYICGVHGAALANVVFCQKGAKLLEIFMEGLFTKAFFNLSRLRNMEYGCFLAKNVDGNLLVNTRDLDILMSTMFEPL